MFDFPCSIELGRKIPEWKIYRWGGCKGLRFIPPDDEGFTLRGDRRRLVYKGRRRSHRFTLLGDTAFEYDCILEREPESNVISLRMEGADNFDFFRQPDFLKEPLLAGSYAVYKKETLIGEGTGKLCHIHRPEIIDARGRRCWGELAVVGNELRIIIPEWWLSEAAYPVIVDPIIGTTTVGSQTNWITTNDMGVEYYSLYGALGVNRFLLPETLNGTVTAFVYAYNRMYPSNVKPIIYSDNNDVPLAKLSSIEVNFDCEVSGIKPAGWRSASFNINSDIQSGSYIWYGLSAGMFCPQFDYGSKLYWYSYEDSSSHLPDTFPLYSDNRFFDYKISMYFTYTMAQNYVRTLTQGVTLTDTRKVIEDYKRNVAQTAGTSSVINNYLSFFRKCVLTAHNSTHLNRLSNSIRNFLDTAGSIAETTRIGEYYRFNADTVHAVGTVFRGVLLFVRILTRVFIRDYLLGRFLKARTEITLKSCIVRKIILISNINEK
ncbi:MAG: hypothetical protein LBI03_09915 [Clostridiales bacterium]|nr:hypothetical protein [Clostridiales bacterium]